MFQQLLANLQTILAAGIGGVTFSAAWVYIVTRWLGDWDLSIPFIPFL